MDDIIEKCGEIFSDSRNRLLFQCLLCEGNIYREILEYLVHISQAHPSFQLNSNKKYLNIVGAALNTSDDALGEKEISDTLFKSIKSENAFDDSEEDSHLEAIESSVVRSYDQQPDEVEQIENDAENNKHKECLYQCASCDEDFVEPRHLLSHIKECCIAKQKIKEILEQWTLFVPPGSFHCRKCNGEFSEKSQIKRHIFQQHLRMKYFKCSLCKVSFHRLSCLKDHAHMHHMHLRVEAVQIEKVDSAEDDSELKHQVDSLPLSSPSLINNLPIKGKVSGSPLIHEGSFGQNKKKQYQCPDCRRKFRFASVLNFHRQKVHLHQGGETHTMQEDSLPPMESLPEMEKKDSVQKDRKDPKTVKCKICFKILTSKYMKLHMLRHENEKEYECKLCSKRCSTEHTLKMHMDSHNSVKSFVCSICSMSLSSSTNLNHHIRRHSEQNKTIKCDYCPKQFFSTTEKKIHQRFHTKEKPYLCDDCGSSFATCSMLHCHLRRHRNERKFKCEICNKAFVEKHTLTEHMRSHQDIRNYKCSQCAASFKRQTSLSQHKKIHENLRKYKCHLCGDAFNQQAGLASHMKCKHINTSID